MIDKNDIPIDDSIESIKTRKKVIYDFYQEWKYVNPLMRRYNLSLKDYINIRHVSIDETSAHASKKYLSTLAVLQLDAILPNAVLKEQKPANTKTKNQKGFKRILIMEYHCPGIGPVRLTVGQKGSDGTKVPFLST